MREQDRPCAAPRRSPPTRGESRRRRAESRRCRRCRRSYRGRPAGPVRGRSCCLLSKAGSDLATHAEVASAPRLDPEEQRAERDDVASPVTAVAPPAALRIGVSVQAGVDVRVEGTEGLTLSPELSPREQLHVNGGRDAEQRIVRGASADPQSRGLRARCGWVWQRPDDLLPRVAASLSARSVTGADVPSSRRCGLWLNVPGGRSTRAHSAAEGSAPSASASRRFPISPCSFETGASSIQYACTPPPEETSIVGLGTNAASIAMESGVSQSAHCAWT